MIIRATLKIILVPLWLFLFLIWLPVHIAVLICSMFHGMGKLFFGGMIILAACLGMWQNLAVFSAIILFSFSVVLAGVIVDTMLEASYHSLGRIIIG